MFLLDYRCRCRYLWSLELEHTFRIQLIKSKDTLNLPSPIVRNASRQLGTSLIRPDQPCASNVHLLITPWWIHNLQYKSIWSGIWFTMVRISVVELDSFVTPPKDSSSTLETVLIIRVIKYETCLDVTIIHRQVFVDWMNLMAELLHMQTVICGQLERSYAKKISLR
jgi:hypothetical protein